MVSSSTRLQACLFLIALLGYAVCPAAAFASAPAPNKNDAMAKFRKGTAELLANHNPKAAEANYLAAIRGDPTLAPAWFNLGVTAEALDELAAAKTYFRKYLAVAPKGPDAARANVEIRKLAELEAHPKSLRSLQYDEAISLARQFLANDFCHEAMLQAGKAQALDPKRWEAYAVASLAMAKQHNLDQAVALQDDAVKRAPPAEQEKLRAALAHQAAIWNP